MTSKKNDLLKIQKEVEGLKKSPLYKYRIENNYIPVIGEGSDSAKILIIGEAPGRNEAESGKPFCGAAGKILDELLKSISVTREEVYITNIVKDRPEKNRDPLPEEIKIYAPFLDRQIDIIKPEVIVTLGRYAMSYVLERFGSREQNEQNSISKITKDGKDKKVLISDAHGKEFEGKTSYGKIKIAVLYHPCVAIYNRKKIDILLNDFKILKKYK